MHLQVDGAGAGEKALGSYWFQHMTVTQCPCLSQRSLSPLLCCRVPCKSTKDPRPTFGLDIEADDSHAPREFERLVTHSKDFQGELGGHKQVQVDWGRAEGVGLGLYNKWLWGGTAEKFPSTGGLNFQLFQRSM